MRSCSLVFALLLALPLRADPVAGLAAEVRGLGWIAFSARSDAGDWDLFLMRPDGSARRNLTRTPDTHEFYPLFSRDGRRLLFRRLPRGESIDGNFYGAQGEPVIAKADGTGAVAMGKAGEWPWASWSPDGTQVATLSAKGIAFIDVASGKATRTLPRQGFFQQLTWSPDGRWLSGVSNRFGTEWSVGRLDAQTGAANAVSRLDNCTPDWFPGSDRLVFSNRPGQWTQLWMADADGANPRLLYAEDGRHVYGGHASPDGRHVLFTGNPREDGDPGNRGAPMTLMRVADAPMLGGDDTALRAQHPQARRGPVLILPEGWEPCWTAADLAEPK